MGAIDLLHLPLPALQVLLVLVEHAARAAAAATVARLGRLWLGRQFRRLGHVSGTARG